MYAYFAGAIDSDGFVSIQKSVKKNKSGETHVYFNALVGFTSTNHTVVQNLMKENFGGSVYTYKPSNPNYKVWSVWKVSDRQARKVLEALMPYLIIRKKQAELVIEFVDICQRQREEMKITQKSPYHITPEMFAVRMDYYEQVGKLNAVSDGKSSMSTLVTPHYSPLASANRLQCTGIFGIAAILANILNANQFILDCGIMSI